MTDESKDTVKNVLAPVFWGFIVALICLPFYLFMAVPQIGQSFNIGAAHAFLIPAIMAFLASALMGERDMMTSVIMMISAAIFLSFSILFVLLLPQLIGAVDFLDFYYIDIAKKMMLSFIMFFPSLLVGGVIGKVFGDAYVSDVSRSERKQLNAEMREWKETLERAIMESDKGNVSEESGTEKGGSEEKPGEAVDMGASEKED